MTRWTRRFGALALLVASAAAPAARAADEVNVSTGATLAGPGLGAHGYDVVAYFTAGEPSPGSDGFALAHGGATWRFASRANRDAFAAAPEKYLPACGGFCAYGVTLGKKFDGDPRFWKIVDGRSFLNLNADIQRECAKDVASNVARGDATWGKIESAPADRL